jgi:hypothetical protein
MSSIIEAFFKIFFDSNRCSNSKVILIVSIHRVTYVIEKNFWAHLKCHWRYLIVGGHFYPIDIKFMRNDAAIAAMNNKAYVIGEFDWTNPTATKELIKEVESNSNIAGDLYWVLLPYIENGKLEPHGDRLRIYSPAVDANSTAILADLTAYGNKMKQDNQ